MSNNKGWRYSLIKVAIEDEGTDYEEQINLLVELYPIGDNGEYNAFCRASLRSLEEVERAQRDIEREKINTWFYDNGTFEWKMCDKCNVGTWDWQPIEENNSD